MGRDDLVARAAYQPEPTAAAAARRFVRDTLQTWIVTDAAADGHGLVDDAVLLTSELVTNAVVHAGTLVRVTCRLVDEEVEVMVSDGHPAGLVSEPPGRRQVPADRTSGRGLLLPAALASTWGVTYGRTAKSVWFRLRLTAPGEGPDGGQGGAMDAGVAGLADPVSGVAGLGGPVRNAYRHPPGGDAEGYDELLTSAVESARAVVRADAAYALMADEDGDLSVRASAGAMPPAGSPGPARDEVTGGDHATGATRGAGGTSAAQVGSTGQGGGSGPRGTHNSGMRPVPGAGRVPPVAQGLVSNPAMSAVTVPFVVDGRVTGLLAAASAVSRRFGDDEAARLQRLADRWGPLLERARTRDLEHLRRWRIGALAEARGLLSGGLTEDEAMAMAGKAAVPRLVRWCAVLVREDTGLRTVYARHADEALSGALAWLLDHVVSDLAGPAVPSPGLPPGYGPAWHWPLAVSPAADAPAGTGDLVSDIAWCYPLGADAGAGVFAVGHPRGGRLPREPAQLVADLACRLGVALAGAPLAVHKR